MDLWLKKIEKLERKNERQKSKIKELNKAIDDAITMLQDGKPIKAEAILSAAEGW